MADSIINLNYAEGYGQAVDERYSAIETSADLWNASANSMVKWNGSKHVKIPRVDVKDGRRDRTRNQLGTPSIADYSNEWDDYELKFDRYWSTSVDPVDVDETNGIMTITKITDEMNRTLKVPEKDCYMYSKLFQEKARLSKDGSGIIQQKLDESNVLKAFDDMMVSMDESEVTGTRTLYVTASVNAMLKRADIANRYASINGQAIIRTVHSIDDVNIKVVPSRRMLTHYDFSNGAVPATDAKQIEMFLITDGIHLAPNKYSFVGITAPNALTQGNYLYYEREFSDVFMLTNKQAGYSAVIDPGTSSSSNAQPSSK
jgi:hypothetical protein